MNWFEIIICILAGAGAGIGTGFAGLSAAAYITPMLVAFLDCPVFEAVGIALASDVLASAVSAYTYANKGNLDIRRGKYLMLSVIVFSIVGSAIAYFLSNGETGNTVLGTWSIVATLFLGIKFILPEKEKKQKTEKAMPERKALALSLAVGAGIGFICGFQGAGGGLMMLFALTSLLKFPFKSAVGTSVFIMTFTALIGAISHFWMNGGLQELSYMVICVVSTFVFARIAAILANRFQTKTTQRVTGIMMAVSACAMLVFQFIMK